MTLQRAKSLVGKPLNAWGDTLDEFDVKSLATLRVFVGMYLASEMCDPKIVGDAVVYEPDC